jgi:iron(III) transport system substrate-binding protein
MTKNSFPQVVALGVLIILSLFLFTRCGEGSKKVVTIYTAAEDYRIVRMQNDLNKAFPNYDIKIEYKDTGSLVATLLAEGKQTKADIFHDVEVLSASKLDAAGLLADVSSFNTVNYLDTLIVSKNFLPELINGGAIIVNKKVLEEKGLRIPTSYDDLLRPEYKNLIVMPSPKASGTGYMFYHNLVNSLGEEKALEYFDKLSNNVAQFTASGSKVVSLLVEGEAAIALGMTSNAVTKINDGASNLEILFFAEGSPYSIYTQGIIAGKENIKAVKEVFEYLITKETPVQNELYYPEKIYKDVDNTSKVPNFPQGIIYGDMSNYTSQQKEHLLDLWKWSN